MLNAKLFPLLLIKSECTLWNISFRLFHETQFNAYFITFNLISWNSYDICKRETSTNLHKQKMPYPYVCHVSLLWELVDLFSMKRLFSQETVFFTYYFNRDKNGCVHYRIQVILSNKKFPNWCTLQNIQTFYRTSQSTRQLIDSYLLTRKKKSVIFSGSKQIPQRNTMLSQENM